MFPFQCLFPFFFEIFHLYCLCLSLFGHVSYLECFLASAGHIFEIEIPFPRLWHPQPQPSERIPTSSFRGPHFPASYVSWSRSAYALIFGVSPDVNIWLHATPRILWPSDILNHLGVLGSPHSSSPEITFSGWIPMHFWRKNTNIQRTIGYRETTVILIFLMLNKFWGVFNLSGMMFPSLQEQQQQI